MKTYQLRVTNLVTVKAENYGDALKRFFDDEAEKSEIVSVEVDFVHDEEEENSWF
jgi:hypothetical protein